MILGVGLDMVEVARMEESVRRFGQRLLSRLFHPQEVFYCSGKVRPAECLATTFAAKEAFLKALGTGLKGGIKWLDIQVLRTQGGPPGISVTGRAKEIMEQKGGRKIWLSLSHEGGFGLGMVVIEGEELGRKEANPIGDSGV